MRQQGAFNAAEEQFNQAIELDPENAAVYIELARTKAEQGDFVAAEEYYDTATFVAEDEVQVQLALVRFYATRGYNLTEVGIPSAEALISDAKDNAEAYDLLGWMQFLSGDPNEATTTLEKAIELDPNLIGARYHLARVLVTNGQIDQAKEEYQRIIDWDTSGVFRDRALKELQRLE